MFEKQYTSGWDSGTTVWDPWYISDPDLCVMFPTVKLPFAPTAKLAPLPHSHHRTQGRLRVVQSIHDSFPYLSRITSCHTWSRTIKSLWLALSESDHMTAIQRIILVGTNINSFHLTFRLGGTSAASPTWLYNALEWFYHSGPAPLSEHPAKFKPGSQETWEGVFLHSKHRVFSFNMFVEISRQDHVVICGSPPLFHWILQYQAIDASLLKDFSMKSINEAT